MTPNIFSNFSFYVEDIFDLSSGKINLFLTIYVIIIALVVLAAVLPQYIMHSIAYCRIAKRRDIKAPWLAWIPVARYWVIGSLTDDFDRHESGHDRHFRWVLLIAAIVYTLAIIVFCAGIAAIVPLVGNAIEGNEYDMFANIMQMAFSMEFGIFGLTVGGIIISVLGYICLYKLYESLNPKYSLLFFLLSIFINLFGPICLLCLRNKGYQYSEEAPTIPEAVKIGWYES